MFYFILSLSREQLKYNWVRLKKEEDKNSQNWNYLGNKWILLNLRTLLIFYTTTLMAYALLMQQQGA